ncbi:unnamed protein product [Pleuronectes platessa]|uniref:Uncharacterized protein n=1 Tax=Pleuronectes platessa TaxID=8262 RepID=A0A9N7UAA4_PLEPL|nr:unnamed protein product [Pleuronectes platessa]
MAERHPRNSPPVEFDSSSQRSVTSRPPPGVMPGTRHSRHVEPCAAFVPSGSGVESLGYRAIYNRQPQTSSPSSSSSSSSSLKPPSCSPSTCEQQLAAHRGHASAPQPTSLSCDYAKSAERSERIKAATGDEMSFGDEADAEFHPPAALLYLCAALTLHTTSPAPYQCFSSVPRLFSPGAAPSVALET